jgi:hypothetical protein
VASLLADSEESLLSSVLTARREDQFKRYGVVELSPEREYLVVTEFLDGAVEIDRAAVDDAVIDQGLWIIRRLWEAGLAYRDIKPANLLVRNPVA